MPNGEKKWLLAPKSHYVASIHAARQSAQASSEVADAAYSRWNSSSRS